MSSYLRRYFRRSRHLRRFSHDGRGLFLLSILLVCAFVGIQAATSKPAKPAAVPLVASKLQAERVIDEDTIIERQRQAERASRPVVSRVPSYKTLIPRTPQGRQVSWRPNGRQMNNARIIVRTGQQLHVPVRAVVIAIGTALQESHLNNYGNLGARNDHDSLGLFQQRPSTGWGRPHQIMNPTYAATKFYRKLMKVRGWFNMPLTVAAQRVQVSGFPRAYAKWEATAAHIVRGVYGAGPYADIGR